MYFWFHCILIIRCIAGITGSNTCKNRLFICQLENIFENIISFSMDLFGTSRKKTVLINGIAIILLSLPCVFGFNIWSGFQPLGAGSTIQDLEDFIVSNNLLPLGSMVYLLFCTSRYGWGWKNFLAEADTGKGVKFPAWARVYVSYILPLIVLFIFIMGYYQKFK